MPRNTDVSYVWHRCGGMLFILCFICTASRVDSDGAAEFYDAYHKQRGSKTSGALITWDRVKELYPADIYGSVLDAGAGNCALVRHLLAEGGRAVQGAELSSEAVGRYCVGEGLPPGVVVQAPMTALPFEDGAFDLVISFEARVLRWPSYSPTCTQVLEHISEEEAAASVKELIRVSKDGELLLTISLRRAWQDPDPPKEATIHVNVKPRDWWQDLMTSLGCVLREDVLQKGQRRVKHRATQAQLDRKFRGRPLHAPVQEGEFQPWFFPYQCQKERVQM